MKAYIVSNTAFNRGPLVNSSKTYFSLVLPEVKIKIPYEDLHFLMDRTSLGSDFSLMDNAREFGKHDASLEKLTKLNPEEWIEYMKNGGGLEGREYGCFPICLRDDVVQRLKRKVKVGKEKIQLERELRNIVFNKVSYLNNLKTT
ncbi:MAG: hypothetical protein ABH971_00555 [bacterium]